MDLHKLEVQTLGFLFLPRQNNFSNFIYWVIFVVEKSHEVNVVVALFKMSNKNCCLILTLKLQQKDSWASLLQTCTNYMIVIIHVALLSSSLTGRRVCLVRTATWIGPEKEPISHSAAELRKPSKPEWTPAVLFWAEPSVGLTVLHSQSDWQHHCMHPTVVCYQWCICMQWGCRWPDIQRLLRFSPKSSKPAYIFDVNWFWFEVTKQI